MSMINATVGTTAVSESWTTWSDGILVDASAAADPIFVATDGSTASAANYTYIVAPGQVAVVANRQPKLSAAQFAGHGGLNNDGNPTRNGLT